MTDDGATRTDHASPGDLGPVPDIPVLIVVFHPDSPLLGERAPVPDGEPLILGRSCTQFRPGVFADDLLSRRHARVVRAGEITTIEDLRSRNGTFVNGERIDGVRRLREGDLIGVGSLLLLLAVRPATYQPRRHPSLVGVSSALADVLAQIEQVAERDGTVLIQGESGVGKELVAEAIHQHSGRAGAFVALNCSAVADGVVHSELFGHVRGAFSGAGAPRGGLVETAAGGTLFLDEIGDASPSFQASLLRLLERREYRPVGGDQVLHTDARFVAASHVPLGRSVDTGAFRRDLHGRLSRWEISVPPLRARPEDIVGLARHFAAQQPGGDRPLCRAFALALIRHSWPGNVRELSAVIEQAVAEAGSDPEIQLSRRVAARLAAAGRPPEASPSPPSVSPAAAPSSKPACPEADELRALFIGFGGNMKAVAAELGVSRNTAYRWFGERDLDVEALRASLRSSDES